MNCPECSDPGPHVTICRKCGKQFLSNPVTRGFIHVAYWALIGLLILFLSGCSKAYKPLPSSIDVWLVAGQSNALSTAQRHPPHYSSSGEIWVSKRPKAGPNERTSMVWDMFKPSRYNPSWHSVCWIYLGDKLYRHSGRSQAFVNIAQGATSTSEWKPGSEYFERIKFALKNQKFKGVLWIQGESDWAEGIRTIESFNNMGAMILEARKIQNCPWYIALNSHREAGEGSNIRLAQRRIIAEGLAKRGPDLDRLRVEGLTESTGGEFVGAGFQAVANAWYEVLK